MSGKPPYVTVVVELEEWDDTTDAIVWLIEQKYSDLSCARLEIDKSPQTWRGIENLELQRATLTGWTKDHQKIEWEFTAEYAEIPLEGDVYEEGYKVTIEKRYYEKNKFKRDKIGEYTIKGTDRKEFEIVREETTKQCLS